MTNEFLETLQEKIGYVFQDKELLERALTHSSTGAVRDNERLEFLGDRVLGLIMAHILFTTFPHEQEGDMAKRHAALVCGKTLAEVALDIDLGAAIKFSAAERSAGGAQNNNILADAMEAVIGALYLDGGLDQCFAVLETLWGDAVHTMKTPPMDPKTALQEWAQGRALPLPVYELVGKEGPDHAPTFEMKVTVQGFPPWATKGSSRRETEKEAAAMLLAHLQEIEN